MVAVDPVGWLGASAAARAVAAIAADWSCVVITIGGAMVEVETAERRARLAAL